jgi:tetratricopeptide (TPR) repeat protein
MTLQRNHYEVLGVPRKASTDDIKKKYRELARKFHPDIAKDKTMGQTIFSQINQAYRVLGDPDRRAQYDASLSLDGSERPQPAAPSSNGTVTAVAQPSPQNARLLDEAETAMLQNNIGKVKAICDRVLATEPRNQKALGLLGDVLVQMGRPQEAIAAYRQALQTGPNAGLQAKLNRLGGGVVPTNGNGPRPTPPPIPPTNGTRPTPPPIPPSNGVNKTGQNRTDQGRGEKPSGGLFSRLLGKK